MIEVEYPDIMTVMFYAQLGVASLPSDEAQHIGWKKINEFVEKYLLEYADD